MQTSRIDLPNKALSMTEEELVTIPDDVAPESEPVGETQVAMGNLGAAGTNMLRRLGLLPAPDEGGFRLDITTELGRARKKAAELKRRQLETEEAISEQTEVTGVRGLGDGQVEITDQELVPVDRYTIDETEIGFTVAEPDGSVVEIFARREDADAFVLERSQLSRPQPPEPKPQIADDIVPDELDPDAEIDQDSVFQQTQDAGLYDQFTTISLGDEQLDALMANRLNDPKLEAGLLGGIRMVGEGGEDKVPSEGNIRTLIGEMAAQIESQLPKKLIEPLRNEQLRDMANLVGLDPSQLAKRMRQGFKIDPQNPGALAAHVVAAKDLLVSEVKKLDQLADAAGPTAALMDKLAWKQQANLVANLQAMYKGAQTDIARALAALRIPNRDDAALLERDYARLVEDIGGEKTLDEQIGSYREIGADALHKKLKYARGASFANRAFSAAHEMWINSILSGYWTHVKNTAGGTAALLTSDATLAYSALRGSMDVGAARQISGEKVDVSWGDLKARMYGQLMSFQEAFAEGGSRFMSREEIYGSSKIEGLGMIQSGSFRGKPMSEPGDAFSGAGLQLNGGLATFADYLGTTVTAGRVSTRALVAEDTFFKVISYRGSLYEQAYREARMQDKEGESLSNFVANFIHNPPERAIEEAKDLAKYITLQTDMDGQLADLHKVIKKTPMLRWVVPFYKTPTNALMWVIDHSPASPMTKRYEDAMNAGGSKAAEARSKIQLGTIAFGGAMMAMSTGKCTGGLSVDFKVRETYANQGVKPYHCLIGDNWIPMNAFEPVSSILMLVADVHEVLNHPKVKAQTAAQITGGAIGAIGMSFTNKSFMVGLQKFAKSINDPGNAGANFVTNYGRSMVPMSGALNEIRRLNDDIKRFRYDFLDSVMDRLPGLSTTLPAQRDFWGRKSALHRAYSPYNPNEIDKEFGRIGFGPEMHPDGYEVEFAPKERDFFHQRAGTLARDALTEFMNGESGTNKVPDFKQAQALSMRATNTLKKKVDADLRQAFQKIISDAQDNAYQDTIDKFPDLEAALDTQQDFMNQETDKYMQELGQ